MLNVTAHSSIAITDKTPATRKRLEFTFRLQSHASGKLKLVLILYQLALESELYCAPIQDIGKPVRLPNYRRQTHETVFHSLHAVFAAGDRHARLRRHRSAKAITIAGRRQDFPFLIFHFSFSICRTGSQFPFVISLMSK